MKNKTHVVLKVQVALTIVDSSGLCGQKMMTLSSVPADSRGAFWGDIASFKHSYAKCTQL